MTSYQVVVVIINHKTELSPFEEISIQQCVTVLHKYPIYMIVPSGENFLQIENKFPSLQLIPIDPHHLANYENFNRLKIGPFIYEYFSNYDYLLFYEPDAFVFEDRLEEWCNDGYDFIGAPWLEPHAEGQMKLLEFGNGGFSLRKISSHILVSTTLSKSRRKDVFEWYKEFNVKGKIAKFPALILHLAGMSNQRISYASRFTIEDIFWSFYVRPQFNWFRIPDPETSLRFSMELHPKEAFKMNGNRLPMGCHAWWKYDLEFWKPFIESYGYDLTLNNKV